MLHAHINQCVLLLTGTLLRLFTTTTTISSIISAAILPTMAPIIPINTMNE